MMVLKFLGTVLLGLLASNKKAAGSFGQSFVDIQTGHSDSSEADVRGPTLQALRVELDLTRIELNALSNVLDQTRTELSLTRTELNLTRTELNQTKTDLNNKTKKLVVCAYRTVLRFPGTIGLYERIVSEVNDFGGDVPFDKFNGIFTAPVTGQYEVSANGRYCYVSGDGRYQIVNLILKNSTGDETLVDVMMGQRTYDIGAGTPGIFEVYDQDINPVYSKIGPHELNTEVHYMMEYGMMATSCSGSRYMHLEENDKLSLTYKMSGKYHSTWDRIEGLNFCVKLISPE